MQQVTSGFSCFLNCFEARDHGVQEHLQGIIIRHHNQPFFEKRFLASEEVNVRVAKAKPVPCRVPAQAAAFSARHP